MKIKADPLALKVGLVLFVAALVIRLLGIDWGLPNMTRYNSLHPDEDVVLLYSQQIQPAKFKFTPGFYNYGTFYLTICRICSDVVDGYGGGVQEKDGSDFPVANAHKIRAGRNISALAGAGLAWVVFLLLYRRTHILGAIAAGVSIALAPGLVVHSRFMTVDMTATFFAALSMYWATRLWPYADDDEEAVVPWMKYAILSGVFAGLSAGTKYTGILALVPLVVIAYLVLKNSGGWGQIAKVAGAGVGAGILTFLITTPGMVLEAGQFWKDFGYEISHSQQGHGLVFAGTAPGWVEQFSNLLTGYGIVAGLIGLFGLGMAVKNIKKNPQAWVLVGCGTFLLLTYILVGKSEVKFLRYTFPMMPVVAMGFGWLVGEGHKAGTPMGRAGVALAIVSLGGLGGGAIGVVTVTNWMSSEDPRTTMAKVIQEQGIKTLGLASDPWFYTPTLYPLANAGPFVGEKARYEAMVAAKDPQVFRYMPPDPRERFDFDVRLLTEIKPEAVVFSSFEMEGLQRMLESGNIPEEYKLQVDRYKSFIDELRKDYDVTDVTGATMVEAGPDKHLEPSFSPYQRIHDMMYIRPVLYLWRLKTDLQNPSSGTSTTSEPSAEPASTP